MQSHDNPYNLFPKDRFAARMKHLHPGNSTKKQRRNAKYFSILEVYPRDAEGNPQYNMGMYVTAQCAPGDSPSRSKARETLRLKARVVADCWGWEVGGSSHVNQ